MKVAVKDACVLMDLANGGLLELWFQLGIETFTTDLVLRQITQPAQRREVEAFVTSGCLKVVSLSGAEMAILASELQALRIGLEDKTVLYLALLKEDAILLTGDRRLRLEGLRRAIEVRGVLWVLDELVSKQLLPPKLAAAKLKKMLELGAYLPPAECEQRLTRWLAA
jgi:hypothetical protein